MKVTVINDGLSEARAEELRQLLNDFFQEDLITFYDSMDMAFIFASDDNCNIKPIQQDVEIIHALKIIKEAKTSKCNSNHDNIFMGVLE